MLPSFQLVLLYLDPTTGGILLQTILGGTAGGLVLVKLFWRRIVSLVSRNKGLNSENGEPEDPASEGQET